MIEKKTNHAENPFHVVKIKHQAFPFLISVLTSFMGNFMFWLYYPQTCLKVILQRNNELNSEEKHTI